MRHQRRIVLGAMCAAAAAAAFPAIVRADSFPSKPIRIIVPVPPGGSNDVLARMLGQKMSETFNQPVIVENRPGAAGNIATDFLVKSEADGYTIAVAPNQTVSVNPVLYPNLPFDVLKDVQGITMLGRVPMVLLVSPNIKAASVSELITLAKARTEALSYASAGAGSPQHMAAEVFKSMTGVNLIHVPYKGTAPAMIDVLAGNVDMIFAR